MPAPGWPAGDDSLIGEDYERRCLRALRDGGMPVLQVKLATPDPLCNPRHLKALIDELS